MSDVPAPPAVSADRALARLQEGNRSFVRSSSRERGAFVAGQHPFAIVLSCSDSRVPAELIFDQGLGDLFVIRVAGNIVAPSLVGSVEFAASAFGTRLVVVMGHSRCGAIRATLDHICLGHSAGSDNIRDIIERCSDPVKTVVEAAGPGAPEERLMALSVRANVRNSCDHLRHGSRLLERMVHDEGLRIVGAEYSLESGEVEFLEGV